MAELIANRYANALFEAGEDLDKINTFYDELIDIKGVFDYEERLLDILTHPKISKKEKKELVDDIFDGKISQEVVNFIYILIDKNRQGDFLNVVDVYEDLYYEHQGILRVVAVTAMPMQDEAKSRLTKVLGEKLAKKIELTNEIDEGTIGGVRLELEGKLIDGTIQGKLNSMARTFRTSTN